MKVWKCEDINCPVCNSDLMEIDIETIDKEIAIFKEVQDSVNRIVESK